MASFTGMHISSHIAMNDRSRLHLQRCADDSVGGALIVETVNLGFGSPQGVPCLGEITAGHQESQPPSIYRLNWGVPDELVPWDHDKYIYIIHTNERVV